MVPDTMDKCCLISGSCGQSTEYRDNTERVAGILDYHRLFIHRMSLRIVQSRVQSK